MHLLKIHGRIRYQIKKGHRKGVEVNGMYKESDIQKIEDDFGLRGAKPYIYTKGNQWFILHWKNVPKEVEGYSVNPYKTVAQIP